MEASFVKVADGVTIGYSCFGKPTKEALIFCPGLGATQLGFMADAEYFSSKGMFVICPDLRGQGASSNPEPFEKIQFTPRKLAEDMIELLRSLGVEQVDFVGNSLGGLVGLEIIAAEPKLVRSLTTFGTTYELNFPKLVVPIQALIYKLIGKKRLPGFVANRSSKKAEVQSVIKAQYQSFSRDVAKMISAHIYRYSYLDVINQWKGPILLLRGDLDSSINNQLQSTLALLQQRDNFWVVEIEDAGHFTNLDAPQSVRLSIMKFLENTGKE